MDFLPLLKTLGGALFSALLSLLGIQKEDKQQEEQAHALEESQEDAKAFAAPDRGKPGTIDAFRLHRGESERT